MQIKASKQASKQASKHLLPLLTGFLFTALLVSGCPPSAAQTVEKSVLVILVEFSDADSNPDARGSHGRTGESTLGSEMYRSAVPVSEKGMLHAIEVPQLKSGMYVISVVGTEGMRSGRILVR
jgi:hypothetical protein